MMALDISMSLRYSFPMPTIFRKGEHIMKTMIYLSDSVHNRLKHMAVDERISLAELIRRAIDLYLKTAVRKGGAKR